MYIIVIKYGQYIWGIYATIDYRIPEIIVQLKRLHLRLGTYDHVIEAVYGKVTT